jgi:hypothetical protein
MKFDRTRAYPRWVKVVKHFPWAYEGYESYYEKLFDIEENNAGRRFMVTGEVVNQPDHYNGITPTGKNVLCIHDDLLEELDEEE